ncbi:MAG: GNAT family N-acetyltransferase [Bacillota bacterium]
MIIRRATVADAPAIARVNVDTWQTAYRGIIPDEHLDKLSCCEREKSIRELFLPGNRVFIYAALNEEGEIVGFAAAGPERTGDPVYRGEIYAIYVLKEYQRRGIGRLLVQSVVEEFERSDVLSMLVWVLAANPYRRFYESLGGKQINSQLLDIDGFRTTLISYGWTDTRFLPVRPDVLQT